MTAFPLSALVGQDDLKLALLLHAVDPKLGGVLIRGEKGSGKSTAARALATLIGAGVHGDGAPFVELPIGATEDRVVGTLDLEGALLEGRSRLRPGLLAAAHQGVLYVDEVNLLADHLVDVLIDAAAFGVNRIERDGLTAEHPCRFVLVGSMNPEEGELRPQLLDRFGLAVEVRAPARPGVADGSGAPPVGLRRRPGGFRRSVRRRRGRAGGRHRRRLHPPRRRRRARRGAGPHQPPVRRTRRRGPPRRPRPGPGGSGPGRPRRSPGSDRRRRRPAGTDGPGPPPPPGPPRRPGPLPGGTRGTPSTGRPRPHPPRGSADGPSTDARAEDGDDDQPHGNLPSHPDPPRREPAESDRPPSASDATGRPPSPDPGRSPAVARPAPAPGVFLALKTQRPSGVLGPAQPRPCRPGRDRCRPPVPGRSSPTSPSPRPCRLPRHAGPDQAERPRQPDRPTAEPPPGRHRRSRHAALVERADLRQAIRESRTANLVVLCVDASGSMGATSRMEAAKGAAVSLLLDAYQRRDRVALVTFAGNEARWRSGRREASRWPGRA